MNERFKNILAKRTVIIPTAIAVSVVILDVLLVASRANEPTPAAQ